MLPEKREHPKEKVVLHTRNKHRKRYDFQGLIKDNPELTPYVTLNKFGDESIDFFNPTAVLMLNKALLHYFYGVNNWFIPSGYLCPPIPGRADYIHYIADLLAIHNQGIIPTGTNIKCLDIGIGANCVYPLIGNSEYGWTFVGSDIDAIALDSVKKIISLNPSLSDKIQTKLQTNSNHIFSGIIEPNEFFDISICNPPFHISFAEAQKGTLRKLSNLKGKKVNQTLLNFGGKNNELWCKGGEETFIVNMVKQSKKFETQVFWFSCLVSKATTLPAVLDALKMVSAFEIKVIPMGQGNKISRIVTWTFLNKMDQNKWVRLYW